MTSRGEKQCAQLPADQVYATHPLQAACVRTRGFEHGALSVPAKVQRRFQCRTCSRSMDKVTEQGRAEVPIKFAEGGLMCPLSRSRVPRIVAQNNRSDEDENKTGSGHLQSPYLLHLAVLSVLNVSAEIPLRECEDLDSSSDLFKGRKWRIVKEFYTDQRQHRDTHEIVDAIYDFAQSFMHDSCTFQDTDFVGKPEDLYL
jgi:hypothetical protein